MFRYWETRLFEHKLQEVMNEARLACSETNTHLNTCIVLGGKNTNTHVLGCMYRLGQKEYKYMRKQTYHHGREEYKYTGEYMYCLGEKNTPGNCCSGQGW